LVWAATVSASIIANPFAGDWTTNTGTLDLEVVDAVAGAKDLKSLGGSACSGATVWYDGTYGGADSGDIAGCTDSTGDHLVGDYRSSQGPQHGAVNIAISAGDPNAFTGTYDELSSDGTGPGTYRGTFAHDFSGSGRVATPASTPVIAQSVGASTIGGQVLVEQPGTHTFTPLGMSVIGVGAVVNATDGRVRLTSAGLHATYTGEFYGASSRSRKAAADSPT
jgi:hypothetical protein